MNFSSYSKETSFFFFHKFNFKTLLIIIVLYKSSLFLISRQIPKKYLSHLKMVIRKLLSFFILSTFFLFGTIFSFCFLKLLSSGLSRCIRCCYHQNFQQSRSWSRRSIHFHCRRCYLLYKRHGLRPICKQQLCFRRTLPSNSSGYFIFFIFPAL